MQVVILCGGLGTRLSEETVRVPKPMVTVGGRPILLHIMDLYEQYGFKDFTLALGFKSEVIKQYFLTYDALRSDFSIDLSSGKIDLLKRKPTEWKVNLIDTGEKTMTGGRLKRLKDYLKPKGTFMMTYGDGVSNVDLHKLLEFHKSHGKLATVTAVRPAARFGGISFENDRVLQFKEKPQAGEGWINGGFFVMEPEIFDYISGDETVLEESPLETLSKDGQLMAYKHYGFWQCMDTVRDRQLLETMAANPTPPWLQKPSQT